MAHSSVSVVLLDVDGTLIDSNDAHASAWVWAFAESGIDVAFGAVRRLIGMGGDKLMPQVGGLSQGLSRGRANRKKTRADLLERVFANAPSISRRRWSGRRVESPPLTAIVASSAQKDELRRLLDIAGVRSLLDGAASSDDAEDSKPDPDILEAALRKAKASPSQAMMIGDTPYDVEAAQRAGVKAIAFRCGGWDDHALRGALAIYDGPWDLLAKLNESPLTTGT